MEPNKPDYLVADPIPAEAYLFFPKEEEIRRKSAKNPQRAIFEGSLLYDENEEKGIAAFDQEIKKANIVLPPFWTRSLSLRFIQAHKFKIPPTITAVQEYIEWASKKLPAKLTPKIEEYLQKGIVYTFGRDNRFRPIFIINAYMINPKELEMDVLLDMITFFLEYVIGNMLLPGQVENWVVIADLGKQGITSLPISSIKQVFGYLQNNYRARMHKSYIVNAPFMVQATWTMVKPFLEETTIEKISLSSGNSSADMFKHVNPAQVEEKFGGKAKNLTSYWPPQKCEETVAVAGDDLSSLLVSPDVYAVYNEQGKLQGHKVDPNILFKINPNEFNKAENKAAVDVDDID